MKLMCPARGLLPFAALLGMLAAALQGCGPRTSGDLDDAIASYDRGAYEAAFTKAQSVRYGGPSGESDRASYVAGLSALRLGRDEEARNLLARAALSDQRTLSGRANVSLGRVLLEQGSPLEAAHAFDVASFRLVGDEADRAMMWAGKAYREAGRPATARERFDALEHATDDDIRRSSALEHGVTGFAIQCGAYSNESNATRAAESALAVTSRLGLPAPRIIHAYRGGAMRHVVQVGNYGTRSDAEYDRRRLAGGLVGDGMRTTVEPIAIESD